MAGGHVHEFLRAWEADRERIFLSARRGDADEAVNILVGDSHDPLYEVLFNLIDSTMELPHPGWLLMRIGLQGTDLAARRVWRVEAALDGFDGPITMRFSDRTTHTVQNPRYVAPPEVELPRALDVGRALLEPITLEEYRGSERLLTELWKAVDHEQLTAAQQHQILAVAELLQAERHRTEPDASARWKLVGAVRSALKYLVREAPRDALAWWKFAEILSDIRWHELARSLPT